MCAAFHLPPPLGLHPVPGAFSHRVFRLETAAGAYAVKALRNPWNEPHWTRWLDAAWQVELAAIDAGVRAPRPVPHPSDGGWLAWVESEHGEQQVPVRAHEWLDGQPAAPSAVDLATARWAGQTLATLHRLDLPVHDRSVFPTTGTDVVDRWPALVELAAAADAPWSAELAGCTSVVEAIADLARAARHDVADEVLTHGDVDQKNILLTSSGPALCDWDVAAPLVPIRELADVATSLASWQRWDVAREVVAAYRRAGGADTAVRPADLGPSLIVGLDWLALNVARATGHSGTDDDRALGQRLVPPLLADLPGKLAMTRQIEMLLAN